MHSLLTTGPDQYNFHDNVYIMENTKYLGGIAKNPGLGTGAMSSSNTKYTESEIKRCVSTGFEVGGKFYYTEESAYAEDMYDTYSPEVGVDVFDDIADNFWGRDAVDYVSLRGYFNGVEPTKFAPDSTMTRGMLVTVLSRIAGESANANSATYTDINKNAWYAPGVAWAEKNGIVKAGGKFRPDELATREEMADMLYRYADMLYKKFDLSAAKSFTDSASVNADYADGIKFCTANGIIGGYSDGSIKPGNSATRAEVATMIRRFNDYISMAETDIEKALAEAEYESIKGDALKKMLDNSGVRATVEADGTVKFVPFLESGAPNIRVLDMLNADVSLSAHPYIVIKYRGELDTGAVFANLVTLYDAAGATSETGVSGYATLEAGALVLDMSAKDYISYGDKLIINIRPWGTASVELDKSEYFIIDEIIITDRKIAATVLAGN